MLRREVLGCCKVYISESRNKTALERASKPFPPAPIVNKFEDSLKEGRLCNGQDCSSCILDPIPALEWSTTYASQTSIHQVSALANSLAMDIWSWSSYNVRRMARKASERGGGLPSVQTMALLHGEGVIEVACNLLNPSQVGGDEVQTLIDKLGTEEGLLVGRGYYTDYTADQIAHIYNDFLIKSS
ncbi:unnamed protein product [Microthlaspi erraticum]|uniref:Formiminotransferase N-terminal subdomain domain-containing protein n=1 Tax=Microthlaspi erraticum TaxID=1685480 RepID=A0A6D2HD42_9BRAS|nr:unnamed protein product [Microthlaspi erraticum]